MLRRNGESSVGRLGGSLAFHLMVAILLLPLASAGCTDFASDVVETPTCRDGDLACTSCHGDPDTGNPAPPRDIRDGTDPTTVAVGVHASHLGESTWRHTIACTECHRVPDRVNQAGHIDGGPAEVTWGPLAQADGAKPCWDRAAKTCAGTYCHGTTLLGSSTQQTVDTVPVWTSIDGRYTACGQSCHTNPPGGTHPVTTACAQCHGDVIDCYDPACPSSVIWADSSRHVNGIVDLIPTHLATIDPAEPEPEDF